MKYTYSVIILFNLNMVFSLRGNQGSICYERIRRVRIIDNKERGEWVPNPVCCQGYKENDSKFCQAQCDQPCVYGECEKPNECKCDEDYTGVSCEKRLCPAGYKGSKCDEKCTEGTFGRNCEKKCACRNGRCDTVNGYCNCDAGWTGDTCLNKCSNGTYGLNCSKKCDCQNGGICDPIDGNCECLSGFTGENCEEKCEEGFWGKNCTQNCDCPKNKCNPINGTCDIICKNGVYINDSCVCNNGWIGEFCTDLLCPKGFYGDNCENVCLCKEETSQMCQKDTGECLCTPGWTGKQCEELCPLNTFGQNCSYACECIPNNYDICDPVSGECNCKSNWTGKFCENECKCKYGICNKSGHCTCDSGWQGINCDTECDDLHYGPGCIHLCFLNGVGNYICDPIMGAICKAGFSMEPNCTTPCEDGTYGIGCKNCSCKNAITCNRVTGVCECFPGWFGVECENQCPESYYGTDCKQVCACKNCRHTDGYCKCQEGWKGLHCQDYCSEYYFNATTNQCIEVDEIRMPFSMASKAVAGVSLVFGIFFIILTFFIIFIRMRKRENEPYMDHRRSSSNTYIEQVSHIYEEIPCRYESDQYNTLIHVPVENGYLEPRSSRDSNNN